MFEKVSRKKAKLRLALTGVTGAGKTLSALYIAYGMTGDWNKIALIDTEHERGRFYANRKDLETGEYLYLNFAPPYTAEKYKEYVLGGAREVSSDGVVIIDSFSHAWDNEGGILERKDKIASQAGKTSFTAWSDAGKLQRDLVNTILAVDCHTIVTMRSKMDYVVEENDKGKKEPKKVGLKPVQRDDTEYEFDIVLDIAQNHEATVTKDTTFLNGFCGKLTAEIGKQLKEWLSDGVDYICAECETAIASYTDGNGKVISSGQVYNKLRELSEDGRVLCKACREKAKNLKSEKGDEDAERLSD